jgi:hypothetical protein
MDSENKTAKDKPNALKLINLKSKKEFDAENLINFSFSEDSK